MQTRINYQHIAKAVEYTIKNFKKEPSLEEIAQEIGVSLVEFQELFTAFMGVNPKLFFNYINPNYIKQLVKNEENTLFSETLKIKSYTHHFQHESLVNILKMTPAESKNRGENLFIHHQYYESIFGKTFVASTDKDICYLGFEDEENKAFVDLKSRFPKANFTEKSEEIHAKALAIFEGKTENFQPINLHLKGTEFQLKVWESLLKIPFGEVSTYGKIATEVGIKNASRAVGTAIGSNPISFLIPCHRVIQTSGGLGGYMWGLTRKSIMLGWEATKITN
ncbi:MAG: methylated-DNA--[protein]-cysteine S-methyltransferase [Capnocytophaga sp.]|nr:methylated-DNA--[protein]-cysteine S-methyltransferase [Capnocytophaga sp.]